MKRAFIAAIYAWMTGVIVIFTYFYFLETEARTKAYTPAQLGEGLGYISGIVALVVIPAGMAIVAPMLRALLRTSEKWNAWSTAVAGALAGNAVMYAVAVIFRATTSNKYGSAFFVPNLLKEEAQVLAVIAASVGGVFAYQYAKRYRRDHLESQKSPDETPTPKVG